MFEILPQLCVNALIAGSIYALVSSGLSLTYGLLRILNFAHGHVMMVGAYLFYLCFVDLELGFVLSTLLTAIASAILALVVLTVFIRPFTSYSYHLPLVTTLALATICESVISMVFGVNVKSLPSGGITSYEIYGIYITPIQIVIIASALILLFVLAWIVHATGVGRKIRALREQPEAAEGLGVSSWSVTIGVLTAATLLAAYAGVLIGFETNIQPTMGNSYTMKAFAAMIVGGLGNIWGTVAGAYLLGLIENLSIGLDFGGYSLPAGYKDAFAFLLILGVLLIKPSGLFGAKGREV